MDVNIGANEIDLIYLAQILAIIAFFALLVFSLILLNAFFICDNSRCESYSDAAEAGSPGSKEYTESLLNSIGGSGIWPIAFISTAISTGFIMLILQIPITIRVFAVIFLITFLSFYAIMSFIAHHYLEVMKVTINDYIVNSTPGTSDENLEDKILNVKHDVKEDEVSKNNIKENINSQNDCKDKFKICETYKWKNKIITFT